MQLFSIYSAAKIYIIFSIAIRGGRSSQCASRRCFIVYHGESRLSYRGEDKFAVKAMEAAALVDARASH
jgi:hypothetical protein